MDARTSEFTRTTGEPMTWFQILMQEEKSADFIRFVRLFFAYLFQSENEAEDGFAAIFQEKTGKKGYRPVDLVFSNIGSDALKKLLHEVHGDESKDEAADDVPSALSPEVFFPLFSLIFCSYKIS